MDPATPPVEDPKPPKKPKPAPEPTGPKKLELSEDELQSRIDAAIEKEREKHQTAAQKEKDEADRKAAEEKGEFKTLAEKERAEREKSDARAAEAERKAQLLEVNLSLRDHLAAKHPEYLANAADIMLHVKDKLAADAKPADITKLIEAEAKAFVERTPRGKVAPPPPAPSGRASPGGAKDPEGANGKRQPGTITGMAARF
jgi:hypothetical protein